MAKPPTTTTALKQARADLALYAAALYRGFELPPHLKFLVETLEAVERGELDRVISRCRRGTARA